MVEQELRVLIVGVLDGAARRLAEMLRHGDRSVSFTRVEGEQALKEALGDPAGWDAILGDVSRIVAEISAARPEIEAARAAEAELCRRSKQLAERVRQSRCLQAASSALRAAPPDDLGGSLERVAALVPSGLQCPDVARVRIVLDGIEYRSPGDVAAWVAREPIRLGDRSLGYIEVGHGTEQPAGGGCGLSPGEAELLRALAERIAETVERAEAEMALVRSESYFRSLIEQAAELITLVDAHGHILYESPSLQRLLGYEPDEAVGRSAFAHIHPEDRDEVRRMFAEDLDRAGATTTIEYRIQHADGHWIRFESVATNLLDDPAVHGVVVNSRDTTLRRELEAQLLQAQKMEAVGRLAGGIAHDFNNLLTAIQGHIELMLADLPRGSLLRDDAEQARRNTERAAELTRQLLAFSRKSPTRTRPVDPNAVIRDLGKMLGRLIGEDIALDMELDPATGAVRADPGQVEQVIMNLAVNARDAMPSGGRLVIGTRPAEVDEEQAQARRLKPGRYAAIVVRDTGAGMTPDVKSRIFEPFFTTKPSGKGTGLGLATAYGIVQQSHGSITVTSGVGQGTTFEILLPECDEGCASAEPEAATGATPDSGLSGVVLVVDDEDSVRRLIRRVLQRGGFTVVEADGAEAAIEAARLHSGRIDLVLSDVMLPGTTGPAVVEQVARFHPEAARLFVSGYAEDQLGTSVGPDIFVQKPFTPDGLVAKVRQVLSRGDGRASA